MVRALPTVRSVSFGVQPALHRYVQTKLLATLQHEAQITTPDRYNSGDVPSANWPTAPRRNDNEDIAPRAVRGQTGKTISDLLAILQLRPPAVSLEMIATDQNTAQCGNSCTSKRRAISAPYAVAGQN